MTQEHLDRPDIDTRFEQVGRKTVAQRMNTMAVRDPRALLRMIVVFCAVPMGIGFWGSSPVNSQGAGR